MNVGKLILLISCFIFGACRMTTAMSAEESQDRRELADRLYLDGNYKEALTEYSLLLADSNAPSVLAVESLGRAVDCLHQLNRVTELDQLLEEAVEAHSAAWQVLAAVADTYTNVPHFGVILAGKFERGGRQARAGGTPVNTFQRDRVRALQLYGSAFALLEPRTDDRKSAAALKFLQAYARAVLLPFTQGESWRLQELTNLEKLPEYDDWQAGRSRTAGAPVDPARNPVFYGVPDSWDAAVNDGQRWRWVLERIVEWQPAQRSVELSARADFLLAEFGVQTLADFDWWFGRQAGRDTDEQQTGTYALHTLSDSETIARLASGVKRFELPDEHNYIKLYEAIAGENQASDDETALKRWSKAVLALAEVYENRRQFPQAAEYWRTLAARSPTNQQLAKQRLDQIVGNWGRFEPVSALPAAAGATVDFRFRNGTHVDFVAQRIRVPQLLEDVKQYLKSNPDKLDWEQLQIENLGYRLVTKQQEKYVGEVVNRWSQDLQPLPDHFDRRISVTTPLQQPGAYLVTSTMEGGNSTRIILWLNDTAIIKKPVVGQALYYVADAKTGTPVSRCNLELFGYWQEHVDANKYRVHTKQFAEYTDQNGLAAVPADESNRRFQWLATAHTEDGRFAYLGFRNIWTGSYDAEYQQVKVFTITDRPVYRPGQQLHFKFWVARAQYDMKDESQFAAQSFQVEIRNPRNEKVYSTQLISDLYGGLEGNWEIPVGATLGQYQVIVVNHGGGTFRVEEYKKPEYEVAVEAPDEPVELGETIHAKITAKYYFGAPVINATVHYKVLRTTINQRWYPPSPWDWLYGPGYGWFAEDYSWYPGWRRWGYVGPPPWWIWQPSTPPEVVAEQEVAIGEDGTVDVAIDTSVAKQFYPDQDHRYQIQAEVVDQSRRTVVGTGQVVAGSAPFRVIVWTDGGHYRTGDTITAHVAARTADGKPVSGEGVLRLLKISYEDAKPVETEVGHWDLNVGETGTAQLPLKASTAGQYRLAYQLTDQQKHTAEGGHVFTIAGSDFNGAEFQFNDLEIIPDRRTYAPGDRAALRINTNQVGASVLLFLRPVNGVYQKPQLVRIAGKSTVVEFPVAVQDIPNCFVEAVTVHGGHVYTISRELFVPPVERILNVEVVPNSAAYLPGQDAKVSLKLTDQAGAPFVGSLALAVFDKALNYIAGGSNVADIREFFWKWRRNHQPRGESNLERTGTPLVDPGKPSMANIGIFGETIVDEIPTNSTRDWFKGQRRERERMLGVAVPEAAPMAALADTVGAAAGGQELAAQAPPADGEAKLVEPAIREQFADTAYWKGTLETNAEGIAQVEFTMPENLTAWTVRAWGMGHGTQVGEGSADVVTRKNLIARLQAPRFFVERDEVVLSANVHNYLASTKEVHVELVLDGDSLAGSEDMKRTITLEPNSEQRVDWRVTAVREGIATIRMVAQTDEESDAVQQSFPVYVHGMRKTESYTGVVRADESQGQFEVTIPAARRAEETRFEVRYTPSLAGAMVDALPYLLDYPYGCTEQTLNRFLPAVITQQTLKQMGLDLAAIRDKRTNLNAQEIGEDSDRATGWQRFERDPVFDDDKLAQIVKAAVNRLTEMQLSDGGWGWFSGYGERSTPHTTAVVVHGLQIAEQNGVALVPGVLDRGLQWLADYQAQQIEKLENYQTEQSLPAVERGRLPQKHYADNLDALVFMVLSHAAAGQAGQVDMAEALAKMQQYLYRDRTKLAAYSLATFGLALYERGETEALSMVIRNLGQYLQQDEENQTAWLDLPRDGWWYWYGSEFEAQAYYLKLLVATDPTSVVAPRLVKYLLNNRKHATYWNSTRDTALVVEAFADYLQATGENEPNVTVEIWIDGQQRHTVTINTENLFTFDNKFVLTGAELSAGRHTVELRKQGTSPIYYNGYLTNFTLEDDIHAAGLELKVERRFFRLTPAERKRTAAGDRGQVVEQQVDAYDRTPLVQLAEIQSGDLVEVEFTVESKNDYEYVVVEDRKAAGLEPVEVRSGYTGNELGAYVEFHDERVALFLRRLARGRHSVSYRVRAEVPGRFSALPTHISGMYAPELQGNSDEMKLRVVD